MRLLTRSDVERAITMRDAIEIVKRAFAELSTGSANIPLRVAVPQEKHDGVTLFMPGYLSDSESLAVKIVSVHNRNPERDTRSETVGRAWAEVLHRTTHPCEAVGLGPVRSRTDREETA